MSGSFRPAIGKNVIETLTIGMYDAPHFIYREYVQNAADAIDAAVVSKVMPDRKSGRVDITIDPQSRRIIIEDNATGIEAKNVPPLLGNIAQSTKNKYTEKGFRGIGRLGALGYCDKLTYETSFRGEKVKSTMVWDAKMLRDILNNPNVKIDAAQVISAITNFSREEEDRDSHYFKITLEGVTSDELLDKQMVNNYLSMVAPIPYNPKFSFAKRIYKKAKEVKIEIDEYNVYLDEKQLFKGYKNDIFEEGVIIDTVVDIDFFDANYGNEILYWGWYGITKNMQYIPTENNEKFVRLRKGNIQIGLESRLDKFHKKDTGNRYFIGEVHAIHKELQPNGRRDFFIENIVLSAFTKELTDFFKRLHDLFYDFSKKNSAFRTIDQAKEAEETLKERLKQKANEKEIGDLRKEVEQKNQKANKAKERLVVLYNKYEGKTLAKIITQKIPLKELEKISPKKDISKSVNESSIATNNKLAKIEKDLLIFVFEIIRTAQSVNVAEKLILKIQKEIEEKFINER